MAQCRSVDLFNQLRMVAFIRAVQLKDLDAKVVEFHSDTIFVAR